MGLIGAACFLAENAGEQLQQKRNCNGCKTHRTNWKNTKVIQGLKIHWLHLVTAAPKKRQSHLGHIESNRQESVRLIG